MRLRLAAALLALAPLPAVAAPPQTAAVQITRPAYLNIIVDAPAFEQQPPRWRVERIEPRDGDTTLSPRVNCTTKFEFRFSFEVECTPVEEPDLVNIGEGQVVVTGRLCQNAAVRSEIFGPVPGEYVTGYIQCGAIQSPWTGCTAVASNVDPVNGGFSGTCTAFAPNAPTPIRCRVSLVGVQYDNWRVTCMGTDP